MKKLFLYSILSCICYLVVDYVVLLCIVVLSSAVSPSNGDNDIVEEDGTELSPVHCIVYHDSLSCVGESLCEDIRDGDSIQESRRLKSARYGKRYRFSGRYTPTDSRLPRFSSGSSISKKKSKSKSMELLMFNI